MFFKVEVGEDGYVKNKEIVAILGAIFIVLLLYCTGQDPRLAVLCCYVLFVIIVLYLINIFVKVAKFTYKKAYSVFLRLHGKHVQVVDLCPSCVVDAQALRIAETTSVAEGSIEPLPLVEVANVPRVEDEFVYVAEPEALIQSASIIDEEEIAPSIQPDSLLVEQVDEISFVSLDETRVALRAESYLEVEHAAAYLGLPVESFKKLAKKKSTLPFKKCGVRYLYKINDLNYCTEKMSSYAWTKQINPHNQEKVISEHGLLTTENVAIFLNKSEKTLSNWRDTRESSNEPYGPDFIKVNTSVFYNMRVLLEWCDSPMADKRKPRSKKFD